MRARAATAWTHRALALLFIAGCGDCPPPEVVGADDPGVLYAATDAIRRFYEALPSDADICVRKVKVGKVAGSGEGWYRNLDRHIKIDVTDSTTARIHVTHELCHAADLQLGLGSVDDALWSITEPSAPYREGSRRERREGFAYVCEMGPDGFAPLRAACPGDSEQLRHTIEALSQVYPNAPLLPVLTLSEVGSIDAGEETLTRAEVHEDGALLLFFTGPETLTVNTDTGVVLPASSSPYVEAPQDGNLPMPVGWWRADFGAPSVTGAHYRSVTGLRAYRILSDRGVACWPEAGVWLLDADLQPLHVVQEGSVVRWSRLVDGP